MLTPKPNIMRRAKMKKRLDWLLPLIIIAVSFVAELILGNFVYFAFVAGKAQVTDYRPEQQNHTASGDKTQILFGGFDFPLNSVAIGVKTADESADPFKVSVSIFCNDEGTENSYNLAVSQEISVTSKETQQVFYCNSGGNATDMFIEIGNCKSDAEITSITVNPAYKLNFNAARFGLIVAAGMFLALYKIRLKENVLVPYKSRRRRSVAVSVSLSALIMLVVTGLCGGIGAIEYPLTDGVENYDPYIQQFDAFMKGQLHLDVVPDLKLRLLDNPYNPGAREGIYYLWDRAFFCGKYYSYFGVAPILTVYLPFYLVFGALPESGIVMVAFAVMAAVFLALAVEEYASLSGKKHFAYFPAFCAVSALLASFAILIARGQARFYYIAAMAGMAFSAAFIFFMLKAVGSKKTAHRIIFFALSGISFGLGFHSRVNSVLPLAIVSALFVILWAVKRIREKKIALCLGEMAALGAPVIAFVGASMAYNKMRFGSFFDFGTAYQLTVYDTSLYSVNLGGLIPSFFHYFLHNLKFTTEFPFVGFDYLAATDMGRYVYVDNGLGIFAMPFMLLLLLSPVVFKKKSISRSRKILFAAALASLPVTAFLNFCLGGVIFRYTADISLVAAFLAAVIALETAESALQKFGKSGYSVFRKGIVCLGGANAAAAMGTALMESGNLESTTHEIFAVIRNIFVFWN